MHSAITIARCAGDAKRFGARPRENEKVILLSFEANIVASISVKKGEGGRRNGYYMAAKKKLCVRIRRTLALFLPVLRRLPLFSMQRLQRNGSALARKVSNATGVQSSLLLFPFRYARSLLLPSFLLRSPVRIFSHRQRAYSVGRVMLSNEIHARSARETLPFSSRAVLSHPSSLAGLKCDRNVCHLAMAHATCRCDEFD